MFGHLQGLKFTGQAVQSMFWVLLLTLVALYALGCLGRPWLHDYLRQPSWAMDGHGWPWMAMDGHGWPWMAMDGHEWPWRIPRTMMVYNIPEVCHYHHAHSTRNCGDRGWRRSSVEVGNTSWRFSGSAKLGWFILLIGLAQVCSGYISRQCLQATRAYESFHGFTQHMTKWL